MSPQNSTEIAKSTKKAILNDLCDQIDLRKQENKGRVPMGYITGLVKSHTDVCPWLSRDALNNEMRRRKKSGIFLLVSPDAASHVTTSVPDIAAVAPVERKKGGRPSGTTDARKKNCEFAVTAAKNEICMLFDRDKRKAGKKRLPYGYLAGIIDRVKKCNGLGDDILISETCIRQRFKKARLFSSVGKTGPLSPLHSCEPEFVRVLIQMAKMRQSLIPSNSLALINSMIEGTQTQ